VAQKVIIAGPLLVHEIQRLIKMLLLNDPVSFTSGEEQVIRLRFISGEVVEVKVNLSRPERENRKVIVKEIENEPRKITPMVHETEDGYVISTNEEGWLDGIYDTEEAANYAFRFKPEQLKELWRSMDAQTEKITKERLWQFKTEISDRAKEKKRTSV
jgi:hypothetical protein